MSSTPLLQQIKDIAQNISAEDELFFNKNGVVTSKPTVKQPPSIQQIIKTITSFFQCLSFSSVTQKPSFKKDYNQIKDLTSIDFLEEIFGSQRLKRNIQLVYSYTKTTQKIKKSFSKQEFATLLFCLSLVTKEDFEELLLELQCSSKNVRGFTDNSLQTLQLQFSEKIINTCSKEDIKTLESILLPFPSEKDLFWEDASHTQDEGKTPSTFTEMMERAAWARFLLRFYPLTLDEWEYIFAKAFSPPFLPDHTVIPHPNGYLFMSHTVEEGGAGKRFFAQLGSSDVDPIILYRSTRGLMPTDSRKSTFESIAENLRTKLGSLGPIKTYEKTKALLEHPELGFVKQRDQKVFLLGYSLGGAQAQRDTLIYLHKIKKLVTVSSPGIDHDTATLFRKIIVKKKEPLPIIHITDIEDFIPFLGEEHLWAKKNATVTIKSFAPIRHSLENLAQKNTFFKMFDIRYIFQKCKKASQAHSRLTVAAPWYREKKFDANSKETLLFCQHDPSMINPSWECTRKIGCIFRSENFPFFVHNHSEDIT